MSIQAGAMELGIRHYILKPCDEEKIVEVIQKVKGELAELENKENRSRNTEALWPVCFRV